MKTPDDRQSKVLQFTGKTLEDGLKKTISLQLSAGHLLVVWDVLANRLAGSSSMNELPDAEKRALWALEDICEEALGNNGLGGRPEDEWNHLMELAREHVKTIPVEFVD
jgi:hypothetical protein